MEYPYDMDFTGLPSGKRFRIPRGLIHECTKCGEQGLRRVYSWRRGRYHVSYWHTATKIAPGHAVCACACRVDATALNKLPKEERVRGKEGTKKPARSSSSLGGDNT